MFVFYWVKSTAGMMDCGRKFITTPAQDEWWLRPTFDQKEPQILIPGEEKIKSKEYSFVVDNFVANECSLSLGEIVVLCFHCQIFHT